MRFTIGWPQLFWIILMLLDIVIAAVMHGKPRLGRYSVMMAMADAVLYTTLVYWGGFFDA